MRDDVLSMVEAAYAEAPGIAAWLGNVLDASSALDRGCGIHAHTYALTVEGEVIAGERAGESSTGSVVANFGTGEEAKRVIEKIYPRIPIAGSFSELTHEARSIASLDVSRSIPQSASDAIGIVGGNPDGHGVVVTAMSRCRTSLSPSEHAVWLHVASHLASAYRLARRPAAEVEAVLSPDGRVQHAEAPAKGGSTLTALRCETRAMDRARGRLRRANPDEALATWKGLVGGRWSLVDHVDTDGRRYILAKRNTPEARPWQNLSERERQVLSYAAEGEPHKVIAYVLGLSVGTVSRHLAVAARKVGATSRVNLVRAYRAAMTPGRRGP